MTAGVSLMVGFLVWPMIFPAKPSRSLAGKVSKEISKEGPEHAGAPTHEAEAPHITGSIVRRWSVESVLANYIQAWESVQTKVDAIHHIDEENGKLRFQNAELKVRLETLQFGCHAKNGLHKTGEKEQILSAETGSKVGRTPAGMTYRLPAHLSPAQLYTLGISYLKAGEDEKVAVIFSNLTGLIENEAYKTAKNLLIAGVAWYRLENFTKSETYFDAVLKAPEKLDAVEYQAQARLWKALLAKRSNKETKAQFWLRELVDHHPHSREAAWINRGADEVRREPAAEE
jgi:tetratricopeptide (TPR) repeat protein